MNIFTVYKTKIQIITFTKSKLLKPNPVQTPVQTRELIKYVYKKSPRYEYRAAATIRCNRVNSSSPGQDVKIFSFISPVELR